MLDRRDIQTLMYCVRLAESSGHAARATPNDVKHDAADDPAQRAPSELSKSTKGQL